MLVVIAAGNEGTAAMRLHSAPGFVDWASIGSPRDSAGEVHSPPFGKFSDAGQIPLPVRHGRGG
ncbi:hypothetical protein [Streptomyces sp. NPDC005407]|uniref:hypothetical protein n=1 Tax=Streptomyces sp. NPDC005407 TaxID=3155340 RepID=UPI0033B18409